MNDYLGQDEIKAIIGTDQDESQLNYHPVSKDLLHPKKNRNVKAILEKMEYEELEV